MRSVTVKSDMSNQNNLTILQQDDGDIVISTYIRDKYDSGVEICTDQGGSRLKNNTEIIDKIRREQIFFIYKSSKANL